MCLYGKSASTSSGNTGCLRHQQQSAMDIFKPTKAHMHMHAHGGMKGFEGTCNEPSPRRYTEIPLANILFGSSHQGKGTSHPFHPIVNKTPLKQIRQVGRQTSPFTTVAHPSPLPFQHIDTGNNIRPRPLNLAIHRITWSPKKFYSARVF